MILLTSTNDLVRITTGSSGADVQVHASWIDNDAGILTPGRTNTPSITSNTTTTIVGSPAASVQRRVVGLNITNNHASQETSVLVFHTDGTNANSLIICTLLPGETLVFAKNGEWFHYDNDGGKYVETTRFATLAEVEAETSVDAMVSIGLWGRAPGVCKFWTKADTAGSSLVGYNISSITDGGTGLATVNIGTDFTSANWACGLQIERASAASLAVANLRFARIRSGQQAAGSVQVECWDGTGTTSLLADPAAWHVCGYGDQ